MPKVIRVTLSTDSIQSAIRDLDAYKREIKEKAMAACEKIADHIAYEAQTGFSTAMLNDNRDLSNVTVYTETSRNTARVIASGEQAAFIEFGAGVYYNGENGTSPHPKGEELGYTIGSYGYGNGARQAWSYYDGSQWVRTHGTRARMPLFKARLNVEAEIPSIVQGEFSK